MSSPQSSFALDLAQTSRILSAHSERSLCLLDEFGKGTTPVDGERSALHREISPRLDSNISLYVSGIALLAATVKHFAKHRGKAIFILHFTEIIHDLILTEADMASIQCFKMETHCATAARVREGDGDWSSEEEEGNTRNNATIVVSTDLKVLLSLQITRKRLRCSSFVLGWPRRPKEFLVPGALEFLLQCCRERRPSKSACDFAAPSSGPAAAVKAAMGGNGQVYRRCCVMKSTASCCSTSCKQRIGPLQIRAREQRMVKILLLSTSWKRSCLSCNLCELQRVGWAHKNVNLKTIIG